jgi:hypothetical protein
MNEELQERLFTDYPEILSKDNFPSGIPCDDGWYDLIDNMCYHVSRRISNVNWGWGKTDILQQVPVRILDMNHGASGSLSVELFVDYQTVPNDRQLREIENRVSSVKDYTESISGRTCELTGKPGKLHTKRTDRLVSKVLCKELAKALDYVDYYNWHSEGGEEDE